MRSRGRYPIWAACCVTENAPEMTAWEALTVAAAARITLGIRAQLAPTRKKGVIIAVGRLGASHSEHHRRQREERRAEMPEEEGGRVGGGQRLEYRRVADDAADAPGGDYREPDGHHRPAQPPAPARPEPLDHEEADEDHGGDREHDGAHGRRRDLHALDGGEHGNGRGDDDVAEKQPR